MLVELEMRTQHNDDSPLEYVTAKQELCLDAKHLASEVEKVEKGTRQANTTLAAYFRCGTFYN